MPSHASIDDGTASPRPPHTTARARLHENSLPRSDSERPVGDGDAAARTICLAQTSRRRQCHLPRVAAANLMDTWPSPGRRRDAPSVRERPHPDRTIYVAVHEDNTQHIKVRLLDLRQSRSQRTAACTIRQRSVLWICDSPSRVKRPADKAVLDYLTTTEQNHPGAEPPSRPSEARAPAISQSSALEDTRGGTRAVTSPTFA